MAPVAFTDRQLQAVRTTGRSVIVSAAAGSGKTAVLAERCAYLVSDAPPAHRCDVGELLVLTFTDAAAAEMRSRIVEAIRARAQHRPRDDRLREQAALIDTAQIGTIHSFCLWLVRRWFSRVGVDPAAGVMDEHETTLLKSDVLDALFACAYEAVRTPDDPLGRAVAHGDDGAQSDGDVRVPDPHEPRPTSRDAKGRPGYARTGFPAAFKRLVDDYGLGDDRNIARFVLRLHDFLTSLPDQETWLTEACTNLSDNPERVVLDMADALLIELDRQIEHGEVVAEHMEAGDPVGHLHAVPIREYVSRLRAWADILSEGMDGSCGGRGDRTASSDTADGLERFEVVRSQIAEFKWSSARAPRSAKDATPAEQAAAEAAKAEVKTIKERLFAERLRRRFGLFSVDEIIAGLKQTAPHAATIVDATLAFRDAYTERRRMLGVLDFADLERLAFDLLTSDGDPKRPSDVARSLHRRFVHVLVDEFQDINPIQQAVIELVSREGDPRREGNLFVVGDVKQSIYRFRLAEPSIFISRLNRARGERDGVTAVALQANFRSRPEIIDAVNAVFRQLLRPHGTDIVYDTEAELHAGRVINAAARRQPVELHLLERNWKDHDSDDDEEGAADAEPPETAGGVDPQETAGDPRDRARWTPVEREAYCIGLRIRELMAAGQIDLGGKPLQYRDIAVLFRAAKVNAEQAAAMLNRIGIPAHAGVGGSLFRAREIRDVTAALEVLDNAQQDIPLAAVLRSGILGEWFTADDLVEIRCLDRDIPFHAVVRMYAECGENRELRDRLSRLSGRIGRCRGRARRRPLADVIWELYQQQGFLAHAGGLPNGAQRRANLLKLHELARQFGSFRRQGLHRFLRFIAKLEEEEQAVASAPAISEADDVVRIMSIHQAKGLEFPVVFVAGLGTQFNLGDRSGRMIFERRAKIGLRIVDTDRMIEYPSAAHALVVDEIERTAREEELRILYVAMTRAREKLILVGSQRNVARHRAPASGGADDQTATSGRPLSRLAIASAATPLDWLIPALAAAPTGIAPPPGSTAASGPIVDLHLHGIAEMSTWNIMGRREMPSEATRRAVARFDPLPDDEPLAPGVEAVAQVLGRLDFTYPYSAAASVNATLAASELKGVYDFTRDPEHAVRKRSPGDFRFPPTKYAEAAPAESARRGLVTHRVLQHLDFSAARNADGVASELRRMIDEGRITGEDRTVVDRGALEWLVSTPLADAIRESGGAYRREFAYISAELLNFADPSVGYPFDDHVLVRGIVDGILPVAGGVEIVDFKTDAVRGEDVIAWAERYRPQMVLYARAVSRLWRSPVKRCRLVFLTPRMFVTWDDAAATPRRNGG